MFDRTSAFPQIAGSRLRRRIARAAPSKSPMRDGAYELPYRHVDRAPKLTDGVLAVETAAGLGYRALDRVALGDLVPAPPPLFRVSAGHLRLVWIHDGHVAYLPSPASSQATFSCSL